MALTESEARVLAALARPEFPAALTVRQLCAATGLTAGAARRALHGLSQTGLALATLHTPATWQVTHRGRLTIHSATYRDYLTRHRRPPPCAPQPRPGLSASLPT
ncbi:MarR family transcriptional regulator [Nocardia acidivorans]|uniref:MarR family transcriptional regulator n=1 Tax=Nocardia acidivorans TaxID=404580 RepID=UPI00082DE1F3|nr:MarR family transcriptional regulator [Nocardia acidivorans]